MPDSIVFCVLPTAYHSCVYRLSPTVDHTCHLEHTSIHTKPFALFLHINGFHNRNRCAIIKTTFFA